MNVTPVVKEATSRRSDRRLDGPREIVPRHASGRFVKPDNDGKRDNPPQGAFDALSIGRHVHAPRGKATSDEGGKRDGKLDSAVKHSRLPKPSTSRPADPLAPLDR